MAASALVRFVAAAVLAAPYVVAFAEPATVTADTPLYSKPDASASVVTRLKAGTTGDATTKQGVFFNFKSAAGSGWIPSFNLRFGAESATSGGGVSSLASRLTGSQQKLNVTSTIGVRGIEKEDLQKAQFDAQQIALLEKYRASDGAAQAAAKSSGLRASEINYLDKR